MATQHEYCIVPGAVKDVCNNNPCNTCKLPELPDITKIFKDCPTPPCSGPNLLCLLLLLLIPISACMMYAMRKLQRARAAPKADLASCNAAPSTSSLAPLSNHSSSPQSPSAGIELQKQQDNPLPVAVHRYILPLIKGRGGCNQDDDESLPESVPLNPVNTSGEQSGPVTETAADLESGSGTQCTVVTEENTKGSGDTTGEMSPAVESPLQSGD